MQEKIGFIGQGWIGKHYSDDFVNRGYDVVRYALEDPHVQNFNQIKECRIVFVAVPTPTTAEGFNLDAVHSAIRITALGSTIVIKSTIIPGTTEQLQKEYPGHIILHSPEFLAESSAAYDAAHPVRNIIGIPKISEEHFDRAKEVLRVLPKAKYSRIMSSKEAELTKYAGNTFLYAKVVFMNVLYDLVRGSNADWETVREALIADPRIGDSHTQPIHASGHATDKNLEVRGAGGHCFIKDFEAMRLEHEGIMGNDMAQRLLVALKDYNNTLLINSGKDIDLLEGVYGQEEIWRLRRER